MKRKHGFTLIELVVIVAIIAILAAVLVPTFSTVIDTANESAALQEAKTALQAYTAFRASNGDTLDGKYVFEVVKGEEGKNQKTNVFVYDTEDGNGLVHVNAKPDDAGTNEITQDNVPDIPKTVTIYTSDTVSGAVDEEEEVVVVT